MIFEYSDIEGKDTILQVILEKKANTLKLVKSGMFIQKANTDFGNDLKKNMIGAKEIIGLRFSMTNLITNPFISLFKISIDKSLKGSL